MNIDPRLLPFVERNRAQWPVPGHRLPLEHWRATYAAQVAQAQPPRPAGVAVQDVVVEGIPVRLFLPPTQPAGTIVFFHGGGWVIGSVQTHDDITADLAHDTGCAVVSVEYSRAPEHVFPQAFEEAFSVTALAASGGLQAHGVPSAPLLVAGDSAGGNLAAACALNALDRNVKLAGQVLWYPCLDTDFSRESYRLAENAPFLDSGQMRWFWDQYAPSAEARRDWRAAPMLAAGGQLTRLPPAYIAVAEWDPLRDDGFEYARKLEDAGCTVRFEPGTGLVHGYVRMRHAVTQPGRIYCDIVAWIRCLVEDSARAP